MPADLPGVVAAFLAVVAAAPVWGALAVVVAVVAVGWSLRPTGRHRPARTGARTPVLPVVDSGPDTVVMPVLTCADTVLDVSADTCPDVSGRDLEGEG